MSDDRSQKRRDFLKREDSGSMGFSAETGKNPSWFFCSLIVRMDIGQEYGDKVQGRNYFCHLSSVFCPLSRRAYSSVLVRAHA
jgi:hypothetical protein